MTKKTLARAIAEVDRPKPMINEQISGLELTAQTLKYQGRDVHAAMIEDLKNRVVRNKTKRPFLTKAQRDEIRRDVIDGWNIAGWDILSMLDELDFLGEARS